jgi:hypothetical protein
LNYGCGIRSQGSHHPLALAVIPPLPAERTRSLGSKYNRGLGDPRTLLGSFLDRSTRPWRRCQCQCCTMKRKCVESRSCVEHLRRILAVASASDVFAFSHTGKQLHRAQAAQAKLHARIQPCPCSKLPASADIQPCSCSKSNVRIRPYGI